jgi:hypothetical protein
MWKEIYFKRLTISVICSKTTKVKLIDRILVDFLLAQLISPTLWPNSGTPVCKFVIINVLCDFISYNPVKNNVDLIQKNIIEFGFKGFMADFGEYTPIDAVAVNAPDPFEFHNVLPVLWASTVR